MLRQLARLAASAVAIAAIAGCSGKGPDLSKQEEAEFKGGEMPESARRIMQQKLEEAKRAAPQGSQPAGEPSGPSSGTRS
jgi:hypothetical protein